MTRRAHIAPLLATVAIALWCTQAWAVTGPPDPGPADPPLAETAAARGTDGLPDATRSNRVRRGLTLPTPRELFGSRGARALRLADRALLSAPASSATRRARAAQAVGVPMTNVGSVGNVKVASGMAEDGGAGVDQLTEVTYADRIRAPGAQQRRTLHFAVRADGCPDPGEPNMAGLDHGELRVEQRILTVETRGRYRLTTEFVVELTGTREINGYVSDRASLGGVSPKNSLFVTLRRFRRLYDTRSHRSWREKPLVLKYELVSIHPAAMHGAGGDFEEFIKRYANGNDTDRADDIRDDRILNYRAFDEVAKSFALAVEARVIAVFRKAEANWQTPGRCVDIEWDAPQSLIPGQPVKITARAVSKKGYTTAQLADGGHRFVPLKDDLMKLDPFAFTAPDANASAAFTITPRSEPWPDSKPHALYVRFLSKAGVGEVWREFPAAQYPVRYRVLSASFETHTVASVPGNPCADQGGTGGSVRFVGTPTGQTTEDPANKLDRVSAGSSALTGTVSGWANAVWTDHHLKGCKYNPDAPGTSLPCEEDAPDTHPLPDGRWPVGFSMSTIGAPAGQANISWSLIFPSLGYKNLCSVYIHGKSVTGDVLKQTVPLTRLLSADPQTFTISGQVHQTTDLTNRPASIDYDWTMSITIQRIG